MDGTVYDDPDFFAQYARMARSRDGLSGAGEWHVLRRLLPDFAGKRVIDLGCGYGWHCGYAAEHGAARVVGVDASEKMLETARRRNPHPTVEYVCMHLESVSYPPGSFDVALSSLVFHYIKDLDPVFARVGSLLATDGVFVFSIEHPVFTAEGGQDWYRDGDGHILHWPVDRYFAEGERDATFLGHTVRKYHHTLTTLVSTLLRHGFSLTGLVEPEPDPQLMDIPGMRDELRRPMMLLLAAEKR